MKGERKGEREREREEGRHGRKRGRKGRGGEREKEGGRREEGKEEGQRCCELTTLSLVPMIRPLNSRNMWFPCFTGPPDSLDPPGLLGSSGSP